MGVYQRTRLRASSPADSKFSISVRRTEYSAVATMRCCARKRSCSTRRETAKVSLRSLKGCHMLRILRVTLFCAGISVTAKLEASSPRTLASWRRLSCGMVREAEDFTACDRIYDRFLAERKNGVVSRSNVEHSHDTPETRQPQDEEWTRPRTKPSRV
jgi:hypothetical protein